MNKLANKNDWVKSNNKTTETIEMSELFITQERMNSDIQSLWENIIVPYLENCTEKQILCGLGTNDYQKFHRYMIQNNEICSYVSKRIAYLKSD